MSASRSDALVIFGITGDLAKLMTFRSLYRLERRGLLDCPIVGVAADDWTLARLRRHMHQSIRASGERIEPKAFGRLAARLSYVAGDLTDSETFERLKIPIEGARRPLFYLEVPPSLFADIVQQLARVGLTRGARIVIEKPFGHDLASAKKLARALHRVVEERQLFRVDHFLGKLGLEEFAYLRFANRLLTPIWDREHIRSVQITLAESLDIEDRGRFYDSVGALRDVVVNHILQLVAAAAMEEPRRGGTVDDAKHLLLRAVADASPARYVRGQYAGYKSTPGVAYRSQTETYAAMRLAIDNERWRGVPFYVRAGKCLPVTQTEVRLAFRHQPAPRVLRRAREPHANELVVRIDPATGVRIVLDARRRDSQGPEPINLDMEFADEGGEGPTPYETLFEAAVGGDHSRFVRQDTVDESWRIVQPLLEAPPTLHRYRRGSWGPTAAAKLLIDDDKWNEPWTS